jgi:hypothetical protein
MDGSVTTVIILIFVFSILGSVTNQHPKVARPKASFPEIPTAEQPYDTSQTYSQVDIANIPSPLFVAGYSEGLVEGIKKFISSYAKNIDGWEAQNIANSIIKHSKTYDVNPKLICGLIARESRFNRFAISPSGAQGLGQLLPSTASGLNISDPFDIDQNIMGTTRYIKSLLDRFSGSSKVTFALAGYLEGPNAVKNNNGFKSASKRYIEDILNITNRL